MDGVVIQIFNAFLSVVQIKFAKVLRKENTVQSMINANLVCTALLKNSQLTLSASTRRAMLRLA